MHRAFDFALPLITIRNKLLYTTLPITNFPKMPALSGQVRPAHALVNAIRHARTPGLKGEAIYQEKWYLDLPSEPTPPAKNALWSDIRSSGLGEVLLDIVTQGVEGPGPINQGEVYLQISSLQALYHIVRNLRASWDKKNPLETALREKVMTITRTLARLERHEFRVLGDLVFAREFVTRIISHVMEKLRWDFPFLDGIQTYRDSLLQVTFTCLFGEAHSAGMGSSKPDPFLVQRAVIIAAILADNFGFSNNVSETQVSRYGTSQIVNRFQLILKDPEYRDSKLGGILTGMSAVMLHLWVDARIRRPLVIRGQVHDAMMKRFWNYQINRPDDNLLELGPCGLSAVGFLCDIVEYALEVHKDSSILEEDVPWKLIIGHDLFFAFGMILAGSKKYGCFAKGEKEKISTLEMWKKFGEDLGLDETEARAAIQANNSALVDTEITCANIKCPLFGENILGRLAPPLRCSMCRLVYYCSPGCQKRDWKDGRHQSTCVRLHESTRLTV
ncbi:hypothetical protein M407DRAFT_22220 [Tulasnella calospora MUT 4182]|uniref:MYND-type domain-containing protein n=1 Tax=Tulasnella calospora MUT 4182 TaxID=1051891 RepID=A0A0C3L483_9AGAM|nr:hypothetical protein M407DRAFT_22220 [Tulasnella calospora MUT 4182]